MDVLALKVTPMLVLPDIVPVLKQYLALGFEPDEGGDIDCVGLRAGKSQLILVSTRLMEREFKRSTVAPLVGCTVPYVYVSSLAEAKTRLEPSAMIVEEKATADGSLEAVVVQHGQFMILAEKVG